MVWNRNNIIRHNDFLDNISSNKTCTMVDLSAADNWNKGPETACEVANQNNQQPLDDSWSWKHWLVLHSNGKLSKQLKELRMVCGHMLTKGAFLQILAAPLAPPGP